MGVAKITDADLNGKGNIGKADTPGVAITEMQRIMDEIPREVITPKFNALIDALKSVLDSDSGADNIGVTAVTGRTGATVQALLEAEAAAEIAHEKRVDNPHAVTKNQVGLGSVDNTADANKPVSTAQAAAIGAHANRTDNPHSVTAAQAGAYTKAETDSAIDAKVKAIGAGDMTKAVYDPDGDGIVDDAEKLGGVLPSGYATAAQGAEADALVSGTTPAGNATLFDNKTVAQIMSQVMLLAHPVGSIFESTDSTSPATLFGGTWTQIKDRFLLAAGDIYTVGATGGEATHALTNSEMPAHSHGPKVNGERFACLTGTATVTGLGFSAGSNVDLAWATENVGGGAAHNNMPPYLTVYVWQRTA